VRSARRRRWSGALGWSLSGGAAAGICGAGLLLSWSRGAWLAAAVAGGTLVLLLLGRMVLPPWSARKVAWGATAMLVGLVALNVAPAGLLPASVEGRLGSVATTFAVWNVADAEITDANYATIERVAHWQAAAAMWRDRPWLGQGPGSYALLYDKYRLPRWSDPLGHAHNYYLMLLAESGLIGLAAYLLFFSSAYWLALSRWLSPRSRLDWALGVGTAGVLAALAFHSLVDDLYVHDLTIHVGLLLGLCAGGPRPSRDPR
jgi:O-antigen ligase